MAPGNNERHPNHTGTIPKTKVRNNCNVPQEAVTPTRRDMSTNLVTTSLDWVPVSEYNPRSNRNQSRKPANNISDHDFTDLDNSVSFETGFGRFVPVRPQPRVLPLNVQNRESVPSEHNEDNNSASASGYSLHPYAHPVTNGLIPHSNHAAAAVMIVNPTTPNAITGNMSQPYNASGNQNRNNLTRNLNAARNNFDGCSNSSASNNNATPPMSNSRTANKSVNIMNNMYDSAQSSTSNINENNNSHRGSARALGEAIVAACPDVAAVERRLGQIREYIRVTSSLVDTMRNSEDEDAVVRPTSVQSNGSTYSDNELWQNEIKNKMEMSQQRLATLQQQQKRLLKYQAEAKQQLAEINRARQVQELQPSTSHDNLVGLGQTFGSNFQHPNRMYAANQIGVATTLTHSGDVSHHQGISQQHISSGSIASSNADHVDQHGHQDNRFTRDTNATNNEGNSGVRESDGEGDEGMLSERGRELTMKLRELQLKKQHMENLVSEFGTIKLQMTTQFGVNAFTNNTYSSSGEDSADDEPGQKCNKSSSHIKNDDPFKLMEIKAIKTALQKTKDLMRSVENYETEHLSGVHTADDNFHMTNHSNINDNKSEGDWSNEGSSVCRVRNTLPTRHKFTNEQHSHQQSHDANIASLQDFAQQLRLETEKIMDERARLKDVLSNKEFIRKQKKVNEEVRASTSGGVGPAGGPGPAAGPWPMGGPGPSGGPGPASGPWSAGGPGPASGPWSAGGPGPASGPWPAGGPGPAERRQMELLAILAEKQKQLDDLFAKEKTLCSASEGQKIKTDSRTASVINQSYNSEQEEQDSRSEQILMDVQNVRENDNFRGSGDNVYGDRSHNVLPNHLGSTYCSDSDSASRNKSNQRSRGRRRQPLERHFDDNVVPQTNVRHIVHEPRAETPTANMIPPMTQNGDNSINNAPFSHLPPPSWGSAKSNQDMRTNQFTQNSHSQTMERLLGTPQLSYPPSMPYNMMMPFGMVGGCGCGCGMWGAWCWQQLGLQQREIHQLREQLNHLEERWRVDTVSHTLNNQVPPGNRANNYWDNFRSYSRQNLLSANSKTNASGHLTVGPAHNPHPLVERSHNTLRPTSDTTTKRNTNTTGATNGATNLDGGARHGRRNLAYERSPSFSSAPDVLNVNNADPEPPSDDGSNVNLNRHDAASNPFRNLNISNTIPEIVQSHSNNINSSTNSFNAKKKSSSKLPAKNSVNRRNHTSDYAQNGDVAGASETPNPNLASTGRETRDKATSKLFDLLRENVYSEVTTLIGVNESHPDFLIQLFRELQLISNDALRQKVLQSIRNVLGQYSSILENRNVEVVADDENRTENVSTTTGDRSATSPSRETNAACTTSTQHDNNIVRFLLAKNEETCTPELLETLATRIGDVDGRQSHCSKKRLAEFLSKYEGIRLRDVYTEIIENLPMLVSMSGECDDTQQTGAHSESGILQDVAGSLNLFSSSDTQLHRLNACPYELWSHVHIDMETEDSHQEDHGPDAKVDLIDCTEMHNGDLAEADQTCPSDLGDHGGEDQNNVEMLPDVVDTEETTPTEAEAEWLGLDRVPTRLHMEDTSENQKD